VTDRPCDISPSRDCSYIDRSSIRPEKRRPSGGEPEVLCHPAVDDGRAGRRIEKLLNACLLWALGRDIIVTGSS